MAKKFEISVEAERFIHNDLSSCAHYFQNQTNKKFKSGETDGVYLDMMAGLAFSAFSIEAKVNFIGWKQLEDGWPERASLREKIALLNKLFGLNIDWGCRPWQTVKQLKKFRDAIAHGKPEIVNTSKIVDVEPAVWDALKGQWEDSVTPDFLNRCREDEKKIWEILLDSAGIEVHETLTHGGHSLKTIVEPN